MNQRNADPLEQAPETDKTHEVPTKKGNSDTGLTDDERVSREESEGDGARVKPGPADLERAPTP
ncbi:MAG: hypothetical protein M3Q94_09480 [Pseudomonadota bacterium]|nr:hypothetical protein [Pseudomonadota bacterium]